jgi:hypothetical protein
MSVYQRSGLWYYDFSYQRERYRGPCGSGIKTKTAARQVEAKKRGEAQAGEIGARKAPLLCDFAPHFLKLIEESQHLRPATKRGYAYGLQFACQYSDLAQEAGSNPQRDCRSSHIPRRFQRQYGASHPAPPSAYRPEAQAAAGCA